jgi:hypothetical protein
MTGILPGFRDKTIIRSGRIHYRYTTKLSDVI